MVSANQIPGFLNQTFLQNKSMKQAKSQKSQKLKVDRKFLGWAWSKRGVGNLVSGL